MLKLKIATQLNCDSLIYNALIKNSDTEGLIRASLIHKMKREINIFSKSMNKKYPQKSLCFSAFEKKPQILVNKKNRGLWTIWHAEFNNIDLMAKICAEDIMILKLKF